MVIAILARGIDGNDVCMMQFGRRSGLTLKSYHGLRRQSESDLEHLERDLAVERHLARLVHDTHPTAAQCADEFKITEALERCRGHRKREFMVSLIKPVAKIDTRPKLFV